MLLIAAAHFERCAGTTWAVQLQREQRCSVVVAVLGLAIFQPWTYVARLVVALAVMASNSIAYCAVFGCGILCGAVALPLLMVRHYFARACTVSNALSGLRLLPSTSRYPKRSHSLHVKRISCMRAWVPTAGDFGHRSEVQHASRPAPQAAQLQWQPSAHSSDRLPRARRHMCRTFSRARTRAMSSPAAASLRCQQAAHSRLC